MSVCRDRYYGHDYRGDCYHSDYIDVVFEWELHKEHGKESHFVLLFICSIINLT